MKKILLLQDLVNMLRRWVVRAGREHPDLAKKTLRLIEGL